MTSIEYPIKLDHGQAAAKEFVFKAHIRSKIDI